MKKRILAIIISALLLMSMLATSVAADGFADVNVDFNTMPNGLDGVEGISLQTNKALKISIGGKAGDKFGSTEGAITDQWAFLGFVPISDELITTDSTVTFWMNLEAYPDGYSHGFPLVLTDASGKIANGENLGGIGTNNNIGGNKNLLLYNNVEGAGKSVATNTALPAATWARVDFVVDFAAKKTSVYVDYALLGECNFTANAIGFKGMKTATMSSGNFRGNLFVDELVVRGGKIVPAVDDVCSKQSRDAIEADDSVLIYQPFDSKTAQMWHNTTTSYLAVEEIDAFNQSTMQMTVPHGDKAFEAYMSLSDTALKGNATVSFKVKTDYTVNKLPGLEIKLADANKKVLGGIVMNHDGKLCYDDGTNVYYAKDASDQQIVTKTGKWYNVDLLVNYRNHSITVYLDGVRLGTVAMEASDMDGFNGILFTKASDKGAKTQNFSFDNLSVIAGLYTPGSGSSLSDTDGLVSIDTQYSEDAAAGTGDKAEDAKKDEEKKDDVAADDSTKTDGATSKDTAASTEEKKGGCGSSLSAGSAAIALAGAAIAVVSKKRKEN